MTIVGKILVIINLVFSLVVGGMGIFVYITRVNYSEALRSSESYRTMDKANAKVVQQQLDEARREKDEEVAGVKASLKRVQDDLDALAKINKAQVDDIAAEKKKVSAAEAVVLRAEEEVKRRQADFEKLNATLTTEQKKNIQLVKENNQYHDRATAAEIQYNTVKNINGRLENQLQEMARDMARMRSSIGATTTASRTGQRNPPTEMVEGLIKTADPSGLVKITLGSDAGLQRGHTMEVFRINTANPNLSKYIGTIRIIEVSATEAVGQPTGKLQTSIQAGDTVASRILGS